MLTEVGKHFVSDSTFAGYIRMHTERFCRRKPLLALLMANGINQIKSSWVGVIESVELGRMLISEPGEPFLDPHKTVIIPWHSSGYAVSCTAVERRLPSIKVFNRLDRLFSAGVARLLKRFHDLMVFGPRGILALNGGLGHENYFGISLEGNHKWQSQYFFCDASPHEVIERANDTLQKSPDSMILSATRAKNWPRGDRLANVFSVPGWPHNLICFFNHKSLHAHSAWRGFLDTRTDYDITTMKENYRLDLIACWSFTKPADWCFVETR